MSQSGSKPYEISKQVVVAAFEKVRAKKGAPGIDGVTVEQFAAGQQEQPVQAVEPDVVGKLLPVPGADGGDPEGWGSWYEGPGRA